MVKTIPERECGPCNVCCRVPTIDTPELQKPPGVLCRNCAPETGCRIYQSRPPLCRDFFCGWRLLPLDEAWRPDRCGAMLVLMQEMAPDGVTHAVRIDFFGPPENIRWQPLILQVAVMVRNRVPVYLAVPGEPGQLFAQTHLNTFAPLLEAIAAGNFEMAADALAEALQSCREYPKPAYEFAAADPRPEAAA